MIAAEWRWRRRGLLVLWASIITLTMQLWVGSATIYRPDRARKIELAHDALIRNVPPDGRTWGEFGMNGTNIRVVTPFAAEALHRTLGVSVLLAYRLIDTMALAVGMLLLVAFLASVAPQPYPLIGALYVASVLPLTYQLFFFHPWDRLAFLSWIVLLIVAKRERVILLAALLPLAVAVKYDVILFPGLYFLASVSRRTVWNVARNTVILFGITLGTYMALRALRPGGSEPRSVINQLASNVQALGELKLGYPPFLALALPVLLAVIGLPRSDRFARACVVFAAGLMAVFALQTNLAEFRAQLPVLLLLLPAALNGLKYLMETGDSPAATLPA